MAPQRRHAARWLSLLGLAAALTCEAGCQATLRRWDADELVTTMPVSGVARANLPAIVSPMTIAAASHAALARRGYVLVRESTTAGSATLIARAPALPERELFARRVTVEARGVAAGTVVEVAVSPGGDAIEARAVLRDTLELLRPRK